MKCMWTDAGKVQVCNGGWVGELDSSHLYEVYLVSIKHVSVPTKTHERTVVPYHKKCKKMFFLSYGNSYALRRQLIVIIHYSAA